MMDDGGQGSIQVQYWDTAELHRDTPTVRFYLLDFECDLEDNIQVSQAVSY